MNNKKIYRILDANLNRAREGLRVIEDTLRFVLKDKNFFFKIRYIRHKLSKIMNNIYPQLILHRNSINDAGRKIKEVGRLNTKELMKANFIRVEESLRVLEEYTKLLIPETSKSIKNIRYKIYELEKQLYKKIKW